MTLLVQNLETTPYTSRWISWRIMYPIYQGLIQKYGEYGKGIEFLHSGVFTQPVYGIMRIKGEIVRGQLIEGVEWITKT